MKRFCVNCYNTGWWSNGKIKVLCLCGRKPDYRSLPDQPILLWNTKPYKEESE